MLESYFGASAIPLASDFPWNTPPPKLASMLQKHIETLERSDRERVVSDADRIGAMADDPGQAALFALTRVAAQLQELTNGYARGTWLFVHQRSEFEHAEQVRYTDQRRYGRMWDAFQGEAGHCVAREGEQLDDFRLAWQEFSGSRNVDVEVCDRSRPRLVELNQELVQIALYHEGHASERKVFVDGRLDRQPDRPVIEAAITYEPSSGVIEVVTATRDARIELAKLFAERLLGGSSAGDRIRIRRYELEGLRRPATFPTDPEDGIEAVRVTTLRLMPHGTAAERITLETMNGGGRSIWDMSATRFGEHDPLLSGYNITQARLVIRYRAAPGTRGSRTLPVTINMPHGCDLKDRTEREMVVGTKYLKRWGLLRDA